MKEVIEITINCRPDCCHEDVNRLRDLAGIRLNENLSYDLPAKYAEFNRLYFGGKLPAVKLKLRALARKAGVVNYIVQKLSPGASPPEGFAIVQSGKYRGYYCDPNSLNLTLDNRFYRDEAGFDALLLHEMIHVYMAVNGYPDEQHGGRFRAMQAQLEQKTGIKIPITDDPSGLPLTNQAIVPVAVLVMQMQDGKWVFSPTTPNIANAKLPAIRAAMNGLLEQGRMKQGAVYLIATEIWFRKASKVPAQRNIDKLNRLFYVRDDAALDDLFQNGKPILTVDHLQN